MVFNVDAVDIVSEFIPNEIPLMGSRKFINIRRYKVQNGNLIKDFVCKVNFMPIY